jgi:hypothetical protein
LRQAIVDSERRRPRGSTSSRSVEEFTEIIGRYVWIRGRYQDVYQDDNLPAFVIDHVAKARRFNEV